MSDDNILVAAFGESVSIAPVVDTHAVEPTEAEVTENAAELENLATASDIEDALAFITKAEDSGNIISSGDATNTDSTTRGVGSITVRSGGKVVSQRMEFAVAKMDETRDLRQKMIDEGRLIERPDFLKELAGIINPVSVRSALRNHADYSADVEKLNEVQGTRKSYPHIASASEDVAQTLMRLCRNPEDAELLAAVASILPDYLRHQQKERHIQRVDDAQAEAIAEHVRTEMASALKRLEFRSGLLTAGGDAELARDLEAWAKRGNNLSIKSNLSAAPHLIPLLQFNDAKTLEQVLCDIAQYIPENGHRFSTVVICPDTRHRPVQAFNDPREVPAGFGKAEVIFNFERVDASTVHITLRERVLNASQWSQSADLNPFVMIGAWDVYGSERSAGEISPDTGKVGIQRAADLEFLKGEAEKAGAVFVFPDLWNGMKQKAEAL